MVFAVGDEFSSSSVNKERFCSQPRSKKRKPTFRKLLKTSNVKLENKLKNRHFKQQSSSKKYRKEQKRLRQALKDESLRTPAPLERYKKRAGVQLTVSLYRHYKNAKLATSQYL